LATRILRRNGHSRLNRRISGRSRNQSYTERLQQYFIANDIESAAKKRAVLISKVGGQTYQLIKNLLAPEKPMDKSLEEIEVVRKHHHPQPSVIVQRLNFHSRYRNPGENVSTYVAELRKLSEHCNFNDLNERLRDQLVWGIKDQRVQRRLLGEQDLTFAKALELAQAAETVEKYAKQLDNREKGGRSSPPDASPPPTTSDAGVLPMWRKASCGRLQV
jgi:hypothetical protein